MQNVFRFLTVFVDFYWDVASGRPVEPKARSNRRHHEKFHLINLDMWPTCQANWEIEADPVQNCDHLAKDIISYCQSHAQSGFP